MALVRLTEELVRKLVRQQKPAAEIRDVWQPGLSIRGLGGPRPRWYFRYTATQAAGAKMRTAIPLCLVELCHDPDVMRGVVAAGKAALRENRDPAEAARQALTSALKPVPHVQTSDEHAPASVALSTLSEIPTKRDAEFWMHRSDGPDVQTTDVTGFEALKGSSTNASRLDAFRARLQQSEQLRRLKKELGR